MSKGLDYIYKALFGAANGRCASGAAQQSDGRLVHLLTLVCVGVRGLGKPGGRDLFSRRLACLPSRPKVSLVWQYGDGGQAGGRELFYPRQAFLTPRSKVFPCVVVRGCDRPGGGDALATAERLAAPCSSFPMKWEHGDLAG